ncbi:energy-coupling factor transporter ATP-binding protein EcfA2 [Symbiobacterium terraclitae]|uniref:Energy-coupling factor transporter ATP-binding protein EcfA2 n=1 Tax=Symbiobacterium terraclitae TaxID=557451 RepID=A0ABS4JWC8_9FIRM|nr:PRK06851 family protein [Symbiobacterium terraclitae]MBP2019843.1 energy-coupling factor transporter ATP-binding protein EcfA2 [Symbiobacterium terraclitae]
MSQRGATSHFFAGANTPQGFYSRYDQIAPSARTKVIILKGGPGTGKSTFLKAIAEAVLERGHDVEYFHCSADNAAIDAIYIPAADAALMDGTAPHVVDPQFPGAVDEIINLGQYWEEPALRAKEVRERIVRLTRGYKFWFRRANDARRAALAWLEEWAAYHRECLDTARVYAASEAVIEAVAPAGGPGRAGDIPDGQPFGGPAPGAQERPSAGRVRRLFASAITYDGERSWLDSLFDRLDRRVVLVGPPGTGKKTILGRVADAALARGYRLDAFHCTMYPERVDHVRVHDTAAGVLTSFWPHEYTPKPGDEVIDTGEFVDRDRLSAFATEIAAAEAAYRTAIQREMHHLGQAKALHDELERCYIPHMDFAAIARVREETLERILAMIAERERE